MKLQNLLEIGSSLRRTSPFLLTIFVVLFLTACGARPTASAGPIPGKEEYGMTMKELFSAIENVEAEISKCMSAAGFEYVAVDYNTVRRGMTSDKSLPGMSEGQFVDQYGYGISTLYTGLAPQLSQLRTPAQIGLGEQNVQIFMNLSPADQVAYSHALFGEHPDATFAVALATFLNPFDALVDKDPRMVAANSKYAGCLRAAGYEYNHERDIEPDLRKKLDTITSGQPVEALSSDARTALADLQNYERALASVAVDCERQYLDPVADQVERELYGGIQQ
jgi:hypothetical protein